jgi:uncharacterized membrane protein YbhN (UPF0104 family)
VSITVESTPVRAAPLRARVTGGRGRLALAVVGALALAGAAVVLVRSADLGALASTWRAGLADPPGLALALTAYGCAFWLRARLWSAVLPGLPSGQALAGIHLALAGNHLLPLRLGEPLRVLSVVRRAGVGAGEATASTMALRAADLLSVVALAALLAPRLLPRLLGGASWIVPPLLAAGVLVGCWWLRRTGGALGSRTGLVAVGAAAAWLLESAVVFEAARWAGIDLSPLDAVLVTVVSVAAQVLAVAPGGFGTYEAAGVAAYALLGVPAGQALAASLAAHALKTGYALAAGAVALAVPSPGALGRLRLPPDPPPRTPAPVADGPVALLLPAHDEAATVAAVLERAPATLRGREVLLLVVDDGSNDDTGLEAKLAGAEVLSHERCLGLGASVRDGLAWTVERGAAAVAFCDADGEYDPAELERLVGPILDGRADYVVGSRFDGVIHRMLPHRRLGNRALTRALAFVARRPIGDGQSGFRALSRAAAAEAEVLHDYNYAQVLTLDLLGKGHRYLEAPISYAFRRHGRSFVRLGRYLRKVVPAVWHELNR